MTEYKVKVTEFATRWCNLKDKLHREDGPAVEYRNGDKCYFINGELHREDGPAIEYRNGDKCYFINGELHREDGPAVEFVGRNKAYFINGEELTKEEFDNRNKSCEDKVVEIEGVKYKLTKV